MARRPPYLHLSRHHVYYCRRAVPPDLRPILQQRELKRSLGRITYGDAVRSVIIFSYQTEALFMHLRNKSKSFAGYGCLGMIVKGMHMHRDGSVSFDEIQTDATADPEIEVRYLRALTSRATDSDDSGIPPAAAQQVAAPRSRRTTH
ncbi:MAG TPA: DUF6538 domain-containing protein [Alphaproteobacteria bacterium]|nr:DUF6538 domain-containing protein [Alphaproteobacteria bacterium]